MFDVPARQMNIEHSTLNIQRPTTEGPLSPALTPEYRGEGTKGTGRRSVRRHELVYVQNHAAELDQRVVAMARLGRLAVHERLHRGHLAARRLARQRRTECEADLLFRPRPGFAGDALGEDLGLAVDELAVE